MTEKITLQLDVGGKGDFNIKDHGVVVAEMAVKVTDAEIIVYHTETNPAYEGRGLATRLLKEMVAYARKHALKVVALCSFVAKAFSVHPELYADIWKPLNPAFGDPVYNGKDDIYARGQRIDEHTSSELDNSDLDIPGQELDDAEELTGGEDEENNYYSLGGDNHEDLEEDKS